MPTSATYKRLIYPEGKSKYVIIALIFSFLILGVIIVKATGGTRYAYLHVLYIPIIISGLIFSIWGGVTAGVIAGLLIGPFMPEDFLAGHSQPLSSWLIRLGFFTLVGAFAGIGSSVFRAYLQELDLKQKTDSITGLPNLRGLQEIYFSIINETDKSLFIVVIELFQMDQIDRAIGTEGTQTLMRDFSKDLKEAVGSQGILGHLQSHQFIILIPEEDNVSEIIKRCENLSEHAYHIGSIPFFVEMRFGVSRYPYDDKELRNLTRKALIAISIPKNQAHQVSYFDKKTDDASDQNLLILHQLKNAIDNNSLTLEYQPKVYLQTDEVMGFEALVRWHDPLLGVISPEDFIPLLEGTLLINPFTQWLLETSLRQMYEWNKQGILVPVSINFSMKNFHNSCIFETLSRLLETYHVPPQFLEVEVTETSVASSLSFLAEALNNLREVGVRIAIDDFGTGQASQQYLLELPIDVIKIDKVFVKSISHNPAAASIVKNAISLAHDLKVKIIAEGLETHKQYGLLKEWGCDGGQGYLIGRSMKEEDATNWLKMKLAQ